MNTYEIIASSLKTVLDVSNESVLSTVSFDKTITAIITKVHDDGTYQVSNGTTKFKVSNSTDREYTKGTSVKVLIPNGDYTKEKVIIGSVTTEKQKLSSYVAPESKFVAGEAYKDESLNLSLSLLTETGVSADLSNSIPIDYNNILNYNAIMIKLGLDTLTLKDLATKGTYTIQIKITNVPTIEISSSELFGNVYYLAPEIIQTKMYSLNPEYREYKLESITLSQKGFAGATEDTYIKLKSLEIIFGWNKEVAYPIGDQIAITDKQGLMFGKTDDNTVVLSPDISLDCWIDNTFNKETDVKAIKYYLYQVGYQGSSEEIAAAGTYWKDITKEDEETGEIFADIDFVEYSDTWQEVLIKAVLKKSDDSYITSNILTYQNINKAKVEFTETRDQLIFTVPQTIYNIYGNDGKLISNLQDQTLTVRLASKLPIPAGSTVTWSFPDTATQLEHKGNSEVNITEKSETISTTFNFKRQYQPNWQDNTITCTIEESDGVSHTGAIGINIGSANTNGTPFSFNIVPLEGGTVFYDGAELKFGYSFQDANGQDITIEDISELEWSWSTDSGEGYTIDKNKNITITEYAANEEEAVLTLTYPQFTLASGPTVDLVAYYPIPRAVSDDYAYMTGAASVIYDWQNLNPSYSRDAYKLYKKDGEEETDLTWELSGSSDLSLITIDRDSYLRPQAIKPTVLNASCIYARKNGEEIWSYPILVTNNAYAFDILNNWTGTQTEQGENYILSNLLGAGVKNDENRFTGVLIGAVGQFKGNNITNVATGLYGLKDSELRFKFDENGEAWIGTGDNYISLSRSNGFEINTNNFTLAAGGTIDTPELLYISNTAKLLPFEGNQNEYNFNIYSNGNFGVTSTGQLCATGAIITGDITATNLTLTGTATIDAAKVKGTLSAADITADKIISGKITPGVKIGSWTLGSDEIYYSSSGKIIASMSGDGASHTVSGVTTPFVFYANGNFGVTTAGILYATGAIISGTITAGANSKIGPWKIDQAGFHQNPDITTAVNYQYIYDQKGISNLYARVKIEAKGFSITATEISTSGTIFTIVETSSEQPDIFYNSGVFDTIYNCTTPSDFKVGDTWKSYDYGEHLVITWAELAKLVR